MVYSKSNIWILPGGGVEEGENYVETLVREVKEETNRTVQKATIQPIFYQDVLFKNKKKTWEYKEAQLRYLAIVGEDLEFEGDPDGDILEVKWVRGDELENYIDCGRLHLLCRSC